MIRGAAMLRQRVGVGVVVAAARALSTRRALPTIHDIRAFAPAELEHARIDLSEALELIPPFVESTEPRRGELLRLLASTNLRLGDALEAEKHLEDARDIEDRYIAMKGPPPDGGAARRETTFLLGVCYQKSGREDEAQRSFTSVLADDDAHWRARFHMALLLVSRAEWDEAASLLERVLEDNPSHATAGEVLRKLNERRAAEELKFDPLEHTEEDEHGKTRWKD